MVTIKYKDGEERSFFSIKDASEVVGVSQSVMSNWIGGRTYSYRKYNIVSIEEFYCSSNKRRFTSLENLGRK